MFSFWPERMRFGTGRKVVSKFLLRKVVGSVKSNVDKRGSRTRCNATQGLSVNISQGSQALDRYCYSSIFLAENDRSLLAHLYCQGICWHSQRGDRYSRGLTCGGGMRGPRSIKTVKLMHHSLKLGLRPKIDECQIPSPLDKKDPSPDWNFQ